MVWIPCPRQCIERLYTTISQTGGDMTLTSIAIELRHVGLAVWRFMYLSSTSQSSPADTDIYGTLVTLPGRYPPIGQDLSLHIDGLNSFD